MKSMEYHHKIFLKKCIYIFSIEPLQFNFFFFIYKSVREILDGSDRGILLLKAETPLQHKTQKGLSTLIIDYVVAHNITLGKKDYEELTREILSIFPNEDEVNKFKLNLCYSALL